MIVNPLMGGLEQIESIGSDIVARKQEMTSSIGASFGNATHPVVTGLKKLHCLVGHGLVRCAIENLPLNASESHKRTLGRRLSRLRILAETSFRRGDLRWGIRNYRKILPAQDC